MKEKVEQQKKRIFKKAPQTPLRINPHTGRDIPNSTEQINLSGIPDARRLLNLGYPDTTIKKLSGQEKARRTILQGNITFEKFKEDLLKRKDKEMSGDEAARIEEVQYRLKRLDKRENERIAEQIAKLTPGSKIFSMVEGIGTVDEIPNEQTKNKKYRIITTATNGEKRTFLLTIKELSELLREEKIRILPENNDSPDDKFMRRILTSFYAIEIKNQKEKEIRKRKDRIKAGEEAGPEIKNLEELKLAESKPEWLKRLVDFRMTSIQPFLNEKNEKKQRLFTKESFRKFGPQILYFLEGVEKPDLPKRKKGKDKPVGEGSSIKTISTKAKIIPTNEHSIISFETLKNLFKSGQVQNPARPLPMKLIENNMELRKAYEQVTRDINNTMNALEKSDKYPNTVFGNILAYQRKKDNPIEARLALPGTTAIFSNRPDDHSNGSYCTFLNNFKNGGFYIQSDHPKLKKIGEKLQELIPELEIGEQSLKFEPKNPKDGITKEMLFNMIDPGILNKKIEGKKEVGEKTEEKRGVAISELIAPEKQEEVVNLITKEEELKQKIDAVNQRIAELLALKKEASPTEKVLEETPAEIPVEKNLENKKTDEFNEQELKKEIEKIIQNFAGKLEEKGLKYESLKITKTGANGFNINAKLKGNWMTGSPVFNANIESQDGKIATLDYKLDANPFVKVLAKEQVEKLANTLGEEVKKYIEKDKGKKVERMDIENGVLKVTYAS